jgi:hypothetical protein
VLGLELQDPLPRRAGSEAPPERGPPQRVPCRYLDAGVPAPGAPPESPGIPGTIAATWTCDLPAGSIDAARWTFDWNRPETWPTRLRVDATPGGSLLDISLTSRLADAMVTRPALSPQLTMPLRTTGGATALVRTWGARAPRSTPPFWLEVWVGARGPAE